MRTEADTCRQYVLPRLLAAGWDDEPHSFTGQRTFTAGRIVIAWKVPAELLANSGNLNLKNPHARQDLEHLPPEQLVDAILAKEQRIAEIMGEIKVLLEARP